MEIEKLENLQQQIKSDPKPEKKEEFKPEPIKGKAGTAKKTLFSRFKEDFFKVSLKDVKDRMFEEVVMPGIKDLVYDFIVTGVGVWFFDNIRGNRKANNTSSSYTSYGSYTNGGQNRQERPSQARKSSVVEDHYVETKEDRDYVVSMLFEYLDRYTKVQVANYYSLINFEIKDTDWNWGWYSLNGMNTYERREYDEKEGKYVTHWYIHMPPVEPLK